MTVTFDAARFPALGTTAELVVADAAMMAPGRAVLEAELARVDAACSRFRDDSDLALVNAAAGEWVAVSTTFLDALDAARRAARLTGGLIDPTVGAAVRRIGYDRDFASVPPTGAALTVRFSPVPGWQTVEVDRAAGCVRIPRGAALDLGATAKAWCADQAAARAAALAGCGVLVSLGGDIAVAGPAPEGGWPVVIGDDHRSPLDDGGPVVAVFSGGLATSGTSARQWSRGGQVLHHIVDPSTGAPAAPVWRAVTVAAGSCLDANAAATAAVVLGGGAVRWLEGTGLPARLVAVDGEVVTVGGWR
ncbi:MAG TPA: FAD:protein FMN transferase [Acidimicrobiales bacterium]|nr:FAD:protein FMN transferase [Acidimicrobiales bacterium]